jgi:demethylmenaquinone methyltransferase/2-methoxy-6-polyprenyl-1,4-benzoquinol methylase
VVNSRRSNPTGHALHVRGMFTRIASRYDLMNRLMSFGQDRAWRKNAVSLVALPPGGCLLDLGSGTGDIALEAARQYTDGRIVALDFTLAMMRLGQQRPGAPSEWAAGDALCLPLRDKSFDAVISAFLMRNVADLQQALKEQYRVLKPGGRWVVLDATRPGKSFFAPLVSFYLHVVIPILGRLVTRQADAYAYLPVSMDHFVRAEELAARAASVGFRQIMFRRFNFGTMAVHWGIK